MTRATIVWAVALVACDPTKTTQAPCDASAPDPVEAGGAPIPGFTLTRDTTECDLGAGVAVNDQPGFTEWTGSQGSFFLETNQVAFCVTHADHAVESPDPASEDARVKAYFESAGMPGDQVAQISHTNTTLPAGDTLLVTRIDRVALGVPVAESIAWAGLSGGLSEGEFVFWPELPASVRSEVAELEAIVSDPARFAAFRGRMLAGAPLGGKIVIHHTCANAGGPLYVQATYDTVILSEGPRGSYHFRSYLPDGTAWTPPADTGCAPTAD